MTNLTNKPCEVTVTVSGERGSGKTYLIAVLAQALRGAGHTAVTPRHTPTALKAITDLSHPYTVTFREQVPEQVEEVVGVLNDAATEIETLRAQLELLRAQHEDLTLARAFIQDQLDYTREKLNEFRLANIELSKQRAERTGPAFAPGVVERMISDAVTHVRDATIIEMQREDMQRKVESLKSETAKLRHESEARHREARSLLKHAITGERPAAVNPTLDKMRRQAAARAVSADDKLAIANGADPAHIGAGAAGVMIAERLDEHAHAIADEMAEVAGEVTLASAIERSLDNLEVGATFADQNL